MAPAVAEAWWQPALSCPATPAAFSFTTTANNIKFCNNTLQKEDDLSDLGKPLCYEIIDDGTGLTALATSKR